MQESWTTTATNHHKNSVRVATFISRLDSEVGNVVTGGMSHPVKWLFHPTPRPPYHHLGESGANPIVKFCLKDWIKVKFIVCD